jgi:hypothetical protein
MATRKKAEPSASSHGFGLTIAAALLLTPDQAADEFAERANVRRLCFQDQGKLIHSMNQTGLPSGETVYGILRARGVGESSIQNAKRAADVISELVASELVSEAELDAVLTHRFAVDYKRCIAGKITAETIAEIVKQPNAAAEIECLAANGKTLSQMAADAETKKAAAAQAIVDKQNADSTAAADAAAKAATAKADAEKAKAAAATAKAEAEKATAAATAEKAEAEKVKSAATTEKAEAEKVKAAASTEKAEAAKATADATKSKDDAAALKAEAEKVKAAAAAEKAAAEKATADAEKRLAELAAAEKAAEKSTASSKPKKPTPDDILQNLAAALAACFNLPMDSLAGVPNMLLAAAEEIEAHLEASTSKAA